MNDNNEHTRQSREQRRRFLAVMFVLPSTLLALGTLIVFALPITLVPYVGGFFVLLSIGSGVVLACYTKGGRTHNGA